MDMKNSSQAKEMADESMVRNLSAQAEAIWPQEEPIFSRDAAPATAEAVAKLDAFVTRGDVARLVAAWRRHRGHVVARRLGAGAATPLILPRRWLPAAAGITGDRGLRDWVGGLPAHHLLLVDLCSANLDVDTPADLAAARRRFSRPRASLR